MVVRRVAACVAFVLVASVLAVGVAEARGIGGGLGGRGGRGGRGRASRNQAQAQAIAANAVRRENLRRARHLDW
jgi:hypothetical protein